MPMSFQQNTAFYLFNISLTDCHHFDQTFRLISWFLTNFIISNHFIIFIQLYISNKLHHFDQFIISDHFIISNTHLHHVWITFHSSVYIFNTVYFSTLDTSLLISNHCIMFELQHSYQLYTSFSILYTAFRPLRVFSYIGDSTSLLDRLFTHTLTNYMYIIGFTFSNNTDQSYHWVYICQHLYQFTSLLVLQTSLPVSHQDWFYKKLNQFTSLLVLQTSLPVSHHDWFYKQLDQFHITTGFTNI